MNICQIFNSAFEIFEVLQKCCLYTKFFQEIDFYHLVGVFLSCYSINLENISCIFKRFEQIHRDAAPLK